MITRTVPTALLLLALAAGPAAANQSLKDGRHGNVRVTRQIDRSVDRSVCRIHGHHWHVTCEQNRVTRAQWTCFVFADHIRKCSRAEARSVLVGKYRVRIYRNTP